MTNQDETIPKHQDSPLERIAESVEQLHHTVCTIKETLLGDAKLSNHTRAALAILAGAAQTQAANLSDLIREECFPGLTESEGGEA